MPARSAKARELQRTVVSFLTQEREEIAVTRAGDLPVPLYVDVMRSFGKDRMTSTHATDVALACSRYHFC